MSALSPVTSCLIFDSEAEEAADFYVSVFPGARVVRTVRYSAGQVGPEGTVASVFVELMGMLLVLGNGGPEPTFKFTQGVSLYLQLANQAEMDRVNAGLLADGGKQEDCGWVVDRFGVSWQVTPAELTTMMTEGTDEQVRRVYNVVLTSKKLDLEELRKAYAGKDGVGEVGEKGRLW